MNKERREWINDLIEKANNLSSEIEEVLQEEQNSYDNTPDNLKYSQRAENSQAAISNLEEAQSIIEDCISNLEEASTY